MTPKQRAMRQSRRIGKAKTAAGKKRAIRTWAKHVKAMILDRND